MVYSEYKQYIIDVIFWNLDSPSVILFLNLNCYTLHCNGAEVQG